MAATTPPLSLGEILDRTVQVYRRNFLLFFGISTLPAAVDVLVSGVAGIYFSSHAQALQQPTHAGVQAMLFFLLIFALFLLVGLPLLLGVFAIALSALNHAAFERNRGEAVTIRAAYGYGFRHFWRHLGILFLQFLFAAIIPAAVFAGILFLGVMLTTLLSLSGMGKLFAVLFGLLAFLLVVALMFAAIWIWLRFCLAFPVSKTEEIKAWPCLKRSNQLSRGSRGRIFVMYLLVFILTLIAYYAITFPIDIILKLTIYKSMAAIALLTKPPIVLQVLNLFISFLERSFVMPIYAIALLLFYNDQRTRHEGYDIELLMAQAGWQELPAPPPATQPITSAATWPEPLAQPFVESVTQATAPERAPMQDPPEVAGA
jgi:hypothetical protein